MNKFIVGWIVSAVISTVAFILVLLHQISIGEQLTACILTIILLVLIDKNE